MSFIKSNSFSSAYFSISFLGKDKKGLTSSPLPNNLLNGIDLAPFNPVPLNNLRNKVSTLSKKVINNLLINDLGFKGLVITDALDMKAIVDFSKGDYPDVSALNAGNDLLLMPTDVAKSIKELKKAIQKNKISNKTLEKAVKKNLMAKYKSGLNNFKPIKIENIVEDLNQDIDYALLDRLAEESMTLVKNQNTNLPLSISDQKSIGYVNMGDDSYNTFLKYLNKYSKVDHINQINKDSLIEISKNYDKVIVGLHKSDKSPFGEYKFTDVEISIINDLKKLTDLTLVVFSKPYSIFDLNIDDIQSILIAYQNSPVFQEKAAQAIFGAINVKGKLPVTINKDIPVNSSIKLKKKRF